MIVYIHLQRSHAVSIEWWPNAGGVGPSFNRHGSYRDLVTVQTIPGTPPPPCARGTLRGGCSFTAAHHTAGCLGIHHALPTSSRQLAGIRYIQVPLIRVRGVGELHHRCDSTLYKRWPNAYRDGVRILKNGRGVR